MQDIAQYLRKLSADCDRAEWIRIAGAFKSAGGEFEMFDQWSQTAPEKYDAADCRRAWDSLKPSNNPEGAAGWLRKKAGRMG
ncbi:MAG: PriCT-2 domain-containing protein [Lentisphaeria bacterium]|nr:PriCT-2 domain-containing protein [Lentisphaeria bacterium]